MLDFLPKASHAFRSILLLISFVNQAFLGFQFFQVQGSNQAFAVVRMNHYFSLPVNFTDMLEISARLTPHISSIKEHSNEERCSLMSAGCSR